MRYYLGSLFKQRGIHREFKDTVSEVNYARRICATYLIICTYRLLEEKETGAAIARNIAPCTKN